MNLDEQDILNDYASRSLRHTADQDYISARMSYKANLIEPFLWSSLHAIEKYFKAILLFNGHITFRDSNKTKGYGHEICELLNTVERIDGLDLMLPEQTKTFIRYVNEYGENRYFDGSVYLDECALDSLDETVWRIRFHCYYMKPYEEGNYRKILMCQHFSGHPVKPLFAAIRSLRATHSDWRNGDARGYKTLRYIQIYPA